LRSSVPVTPAKIAGRAKFVSSWTVVAFLYQVALAASSANPG
jgi:hypothetical protein